MSEGCVGTASGWRSLNEMGSNKHLLSLSQLLITRWASMRAPKAPRGPAQRMKFKLSFSCDMAAKKRSRDIGEGVTVLTNCFCQSDVNTAATWLLGIRSEISRLRQSCCPLHCNDSHLDTPKASNSQTHLRRFLSSPRQY